MNIFSKIAAGLKKTKTPQFADKIDVIELKNILVYAERCKYD